MFSFFQTGLYPCYNENYIPFLEVTNLQQVDCQSIRPLAMWWPVNIVTNYHMDIVSHSLPLNGHMQECLGVICFVCKHQYQNLVLEAKLRDIVIPFQIKLSF